MRVKRFWLTYDEAYPKMAKEGLSEQCDDGSVILLFLQGLSGAFFGLRRTLRKKDSRAYAQE